MTREERIEVIARRMLAGDWQRGSSSAQLAAEWGVPLHLAEQAAAEAAVVLRLAQKLFGEQAKADVMRAFGAFLAAG